MSVSVEDFLKCKKLKNTIVHNSFTARFQYILKKFESLSKTNNFRKIQKVNIIETPKDDDTILNLLNKLTSQNYVVISQKIELKITCRNIISLIDQLLSYVEKSNSNNANELWFLIHVLFHNEYSTSETKNIIKLRIKSFVESCIKVFEVQNTKRNFDDEQYMDFVQRNHSNNVIISNIKMMNVIISDTRNFVNIPYNASIVFDLFINQLNKLILDNANYNIVFMLLECMNILIQNSTLKSNPYTYKKFINNFNNEDFKKKLTNKNKFKLLDICDYIQNGLP